MFVIFDKNKVYKFDDELQTKLMILLRITTSFELTDIVKIMKHI